MPTLDVLLAQLPADTNVKGHRFERLCAWFLLHDPVYASQIRRVWLWADWSGRWGPDAGIDLVAETHGGDLWAIQTKAYAPTTAVTKSDIDSFLSESNRPEIAFRLLIATTDCMSPNARRVMRGQEKPASLLMLSDLLARSIDWPETWDGATPARPPQRTPRPHQQEALSAIRAVPDGGRGRVIMACGTGKTLVQLWAHELLMSRCTLVVVPSLFLVAQVLQEWTAHRTRPFEFLAVCSDETVVGKDVDSFVASVGEIGVPVTTDPAQIRRFLQRGGDRVVFSTYQSSPRIAEAIGGAQIRFDLILADEAHQLAGSASRDFAAVLDDERIPAARRLFFTATPRYFTGGQARTFGETDLLVASMDDEVLFGPEVHRLSFGEAIRRDLLSDYRVVVVGISDRQAYELANHGAVVEVDGITTDARTLARQIGLAKAMHDYRLHRVISFHSRVAAARGFVEELPGVIARLPHDKAPQGRLVFDHVAGDMATGDRRTRLGRLRNIESGEYALLANARCLSEGVDVPSIDGVAFIDPRRSQVDIVQAVGRAIRLSTDKSLGTIVIPVFVPKGESDEAILESSAFEPVWSVVRALRDHDEDLADQLDAARRRLGRQGRLGQEDLPSKLVIDIPVAVVGDSFANAIITKMVERTTSSWEEGFGHLLAYVEQTGGACVPTSYICPSTGFRLGSWVVNQRFAREKMDPVRACRLDALPSWMWEIFAPAWEAAFAKLVRYVALTGSALIPQSTVTDDDFALGRWVVKQRVARRAMDMHRRSCLEALAGWSWDPHDEVWERAFAQLEDYVSTNGAADVSGSYCAADGFRLGAWVTKQRANRESMPLARVMRLETLLGWTWNSLDSRWERGFTELEAYVASKGDTRVASTFITPKGYRLGQWVGVQRATARAQYPDRARRLEALPGWEWDCFDASWDVGFGHLAEYVRERATTDVPVGFRTLSGYNLGRWVRVQRELRVKLTPERRARLDELLGWTWAPRASAWEAGFSYLQDFVSSHGHPRVPSSFTTETGFRLGQWVASQRSRRGSLSDTKQRMLEGLSEWTWVLLEANWEDAFAYLCRYVETFGSARVPVAVCVGEGFSLGRWVSKQRACRARLPPQRVARLEALPDWVWDVRDADWEDGFVRLEFYAARHGGARVSATFKTEDGYPLGQWVSVQRRMRDRLTPQRVARLEALPGWVWSARA
jgi:superfamily II DNA or RNA helicase